MIKITIFYSFVLNNSSSSHTCLLTYSLKERAYPKKYHIVSIIACKNTQLQFSLNNLATNHNNCRAFSPRRKIKITWLSFRQESHKFALTRLEKQSIHISKLK